MAVSLLLCLTHFLSAHPRCCKRRHFWWLSSVPSVTLLQFWSCVWAVFSWLCSPDPFLTHSRTSPWNSSLSISWSSNLMVHHQLHPGGSGGMDTRRVLLGASTPRDAPLAMSWWMLCPEAPSLLCSFGGWGWPRTSPRCPPPERQPPRWLPCVLTGSVSLFSSLQILPHTFWSPVDLRQPHVRALGCLSRSLIRSQCYRLNPVQAAGQQKTGPVRHLALPAHWQQERKLIFLFTRNAIGIDCPSGETSKQTNKCTCPDI